MQEAPSGPQDARPRDQATGDALEAHAYGRAGRALAGALAALAGASLPALLVALVVATDPPITPPVLARLVFVWAILPAAAARVIARLAAARVTVRDGELVLHRRDVTVEIPCGSIAGIAPWRVPLPGPGIALGLGSGRRLRYGLQASDPTPLLRALSEGCGLEPARAAMAHPTVVYARARAAIPSRRWYHLVGRFPLFALLPTALLFNVHQHIAYGALLGEYYLLGLRSWLTTLGVYWGTVTIELVLYASVWRALAEGVSLAAAWVAPSHAARVRRAAEATAQVLYYGGVPLLLLIRFLS